MFGLSLFTLIVLALALYVVLGTLVVSSVAFVNAAQGGTWFANQSWGGHQEIFPIFVFIFWPFAVMAGAIYYLALGIGRAMTFVVTKAHEAGVDRDRKMRGAVPPK